jgi:hypothetical protein
MRGFRQGRSIVVPAGAYFLQSNEKRLHAVVRALRQEGSSTYIL